MTQKYLTRIYTDPGHPASFSGPAKLKRVVNREGKIKVSRKDIDSFLEKQARIMLTDLLTPLFAADI